MGPDKDAVSDEMARDEDQVFAAAHVQAVRVGHSHGFDNFLVFDTHCSGPSSNVSYPVRMTASGVQGKTYQYFSLRVEGTRLL